MEISDYVQELNFEAKKGTIYGETGNDLGTPTALKKTSGWTLLGNGPIYSIMAYTITSYTQRDYAPWRV